MPEDTDQEESEAVTDEPDHVEADQLATSDTGDDEPVAFDRTETEGNDRDEVGEAATAPAHDTERAPTRAATGLVLDEIHEDQAGLAGPETEGEFLAFRNVGEEPIDVSGWTIENEAGRSYSFPRGTVLDPGDRVELHGGPGADTEDDLYWNADEPVLEAKRTTITVETADGERVIRERYES